MDFIIEVVVTDRFHCITRNAFQPGISQKRGLPLDAQSVWEHRGHIVGMDYC